MITPRCGHWRPWPPGEIWSVSISVHISASILCTSHLSHGIPRHICALTLNWRQKNKQEQQRERWGGGETERQTYREKLPKQKQWAATIGLHWLPVVWPGSSTRCGENPVYKLLYPVSDNNKLVSRQPGNSRGFSFSIDTVILDSGNLWETLLCHSLSARMYAFWPHVLTQNFYILTCKTIFSLVMYLNTHPFC